MEDVPQISGSQALAAFVTAPACIGWIGYGAAILLAPHLALEPDPLLWAGYAAGSWVAIMLVLCFGWVGLLLLAGLS